ncbi:MULTISPECIES: peptide chain release factor N(5)-glutamine methyltransferase [unclassified Carboxylicivirga]|uniref:peptide chain release factor N(5)-glutamine methyltransferase n=1 Tax=Carboxylicivirga TaxID=1628153 RepID=UPI003D352273
MDGITIHQFKALLAEELKGLYAEEEIRQFASLLLQHILKVDNTQLLLLNREPLPQSILDELESFTSALKKQVPIQYLLGTCEFYGLPFTVNPAVLIPRPETEELVAWILADESEAKSILDIGTGSGCIAISLKVYKPDCALTAWDISPDALATAADNARMNKAALNFEQVDILAHHPDDRLFDCIVSNPPYVRDLEKKMMASNVLDHEPHSALFVSDDDPLIFYRCIAQHALKMLSPGGSLYFEINEFLAAEMQTMLHGLGYKNIVCRKDINGKDRMMRAINGNA